MAGAFMILLYIGCVILAVAWIIVPFAVFSLNTHTRRQAEALERLAELAAFKVRETNPLSSPEAFRAGHDVFGNPRNQQS